MCGSGYAASDRVLQDLGAAPQGQSRKNQHQAAEPRAGIMKLTNHRILLTALSELD